MRAPLRLALAGLITAASLATPLAHAVVSERIVAVVGDHAILLSDLRQRARPFLLQIQAKVPPGAQQAAAESQLFRELIQKMVDEELESQAAERANVRVTSEEIQNAFRNIAAAEQTTVEELFRLARTTSGLTEQEYRDEIRRQILEGKMLQLRVRGRVRITEQDVQTAFDRLVREERRRRDYHPAWIVLRILPGASAEAIEERRALAAALAERAKQGEDFAELARQFSDDTATRDAGGDLGIRAPQGSQAALTGQREVMAPELEAALLAIEPGGVTGPTRVGDAFVVMKLLSRQPSRFTTLEAARPELLQRLQAEILQKAKVKWLDELKRGTHVEIRL
ncbi:peptidyl-prolyl cis-trans isomerase [Sorangium cellulosum]|uniref:Peptidyl-prolyl cis-trans isomerase n=1 Tax=Sorangium cellulosum TaxID=56 RepID=A0A4V0NCW0_SORCE|nr:peptidylprolyl isomerase [Sorangium cellulosum]AUX20542.1 peptidyl-prolyl cis-trans isomerase [Sorangium cellulosum]